MSRVGRIIAVGGGKGGVGKSLVSTNLAVSIAKTGANVVMLDADLGAPNAHSLLGIYRPQRTVEDFLAGRASLQEVMLPTPIPRLRLICGAEGVLGSANPTFDAKQRLLSQLQRVQADCLVIDVGAGVSMDAIDFFNAADTRVVVMVPEVTSLQNGYAFLKIALFRRLQRAVSGLRISEKLAAAFGDDAFAIGSAMDRVSTFFAMLEDELPELVAQFRLLLDEFNAKLVGNMLARPVDANALYAMSRLIRDRLGISAEVAATLRHSPHVRGSVNTGVPLAANGSIQDPDVFELARLAKSVLEQDLAPIHKIRAEFVRTMNARPLDPKLDERFSFGLESAATRTSPERIVREPRAAAPDPAARPLPSEFHQLERSSQRVKVTVPIELDFDGRAYVGQLVEVNHAGACIVGIQAPTSWRDRPGVLRMLGDGHAPSAAVTLHSADERRVIVRFDDPRSGAQLVSYLALPRRA